MIIYQHIIYKLEINIPVHSKELLLLLNISK